MKHLLWIPLLLFTLAARQNSNGKVEGVVVRAGTATGVERTEVTLGGGDGSFTTTTDVQGRFAFEDVPPGDYRVLVQTAAECLSNIRLDADGSSKASITSRNLETFLTVAPQQQVSGLRISLLFTTAIQGRVLDISGVPIPNAPVAALRVVYLHGHPLLNQYPDSAVTNKEGAYNLCLPTGEYYLRAETKKSASGALATDRSYFPGVPDIDASFKVNVRDAEPLKSADILVEDTPTVKVSGNVILGAAILFGGRPTIGLLRETASGISDSFLPMWNFATEAADLAAGKFELRGVTPGRYLLYASFLEADPVATTELGRTKTRFGWTPITVGTGDLGGVSIAMQPLVDVKGRVIFTKDATALSVAEVIENVGLTPADPVHDFFALTGHAASLGPTVDPTPGFRSVAPGGPSRVFSVISSGAVRETIIGADGTQRTTMETPTRASGSSYQASVGRDGSFTLPNVSALQYIVAINPATLFPSPSGQTFRLADDLYVADIRQGNLSVFPTGILTIDDRGPDDLEIVVASHAARISGTVVGNGQKPAANSTVVLIPEDPFRENGLLYKRVNAGPNGAFQITGVAPGRYMLYSWESIPTGAEQNNDFMAPYRMSGTPIELQAGSEQKVELSIIPR